MLNLTAELGIHILLYLVITESTDPVPPRQIAEVLGTSPTYTAKVAALLARAGILKTVRGAKGGVMLASVPSEIRLLEIVESCQGKVLPDYCAPFDDLTKVCSFHEAMHELHSGIMDVLTGWSLADLAKRPCPHASIREAVNCKVKWSQTIPGVCKD